MELLLGCGNERTKRLHRPGHQDWNDQVTLDIDSSCNPDVIWDLNAVPLPFKDNIFDEVHIYETIEHFGGPQGHFKAFFSFFEEMWRILKPDGYFLCTTPYWKSVWAWADPGHVRVIPPEMLTFLIQPQYTEQVGVTPMTDYRPYYKADFDVEYGNVVQGKDAEDNQQFQFVLKAIKPSRIGHKVKKSVDISVTCA